MRWLAIAVALITLIDQGRMGVHSQCFKDNDRFDVVLQTDLHSIADFSFDLLNELQSMNSGENLFFSPYSIWSALTLAYFGSAGETEAQLQQALRIGDKIMALRMWKALALTDQLRMQLQSDYIFRTVSKIFNHQELKFRKCVLKILHNEIEFIDFRDILKATDIINSFVAETTEGMIKDLLSPESLRDALIVLINAAYFNGTWVQEFSPRQTRIWKFTSDTVQDNIPMMNQIGKFNYGLSKALGSHLLELPYKGNAISMYILLPITEGDAALNNVLAGLSGALFQDAIRNMNITNVNVMLPNFTMEMRLEQELTDALRNLGITDLFNSTTGNLTKFVEGTNLAVDKSVHQANIEVTEVGTQASAATAFIINTRLGIFRPKGTVNVFCERPFIFLLYDNDTNNILFIGVYWKPPSKDSKGQALKKMALNDVQADSTDQTLSTGTTDPYTTTEFDEYLSTPSLVDPLWI